MAINLSDSEDETSGNMYPDTFVSDRPFGTEEKKKKNQSDKLDWSKIDWSQSDKPLKGPTDTFVEVMPTGLGGYQPIEEMPFVKPSGQPFSTVSTTEEQKRAKGVTYRKNERGEFEAVPMDKALQYGATGTKWAGILTANPLLAGAGAFAEKSISGDIYDKPVLGNVGDIAAETLLGSRFGTGQVLSGLGKIKQGLNIGRGSALAKTATGAIEGAAAGTGYTLLKSIGNPDELNSIGTNAALFSVGGALGGVLGARADIKSLDKELAFNLRNLEAKGTPEQVALAKQLLASNTDDAYKIAESSSEELLPFKQQFLDAVKSRKQSGAISDIGQRGFSKEDLLTSIAKTGVSAGAGVTVGLRTYKEKSEELDPNALSKALTMGSVTAFGTYMGLSGLSRLASNPKKLIGDVLGPEVFIGNEFKMNKYFSESEAAAFRLKALEWGKRIDGWVSEQPNKKYAAYQFNKVWKADPNQRIAMPEWQSMPEDIQRILAESSLDARKFSIDIANFVPSEMSKKILNNVGQYTTIPYRLHASDDLRELWLKSPEFEKAKIEFRNELTKVFGKTDTEADAVINDMVNNKDWLFGINKNSTGSSVSGILNKRNQLTPKAKAMLGEITEPGSVVAATIGKQADLVFTNQWEKQWAKMLLNTGLAKTEAAEGLVRLVDDVPFKTSTLVHKNFDGLWVEPHILSALQDLRSNNLFGSLADNTAAKVVLGGIGASKATKTAGNFAYNFGPQLLSNTIMAASSGALFYKGILGTGTRNLAIQAWDSPFTHIVMEGGRKVLKIDSAFLEKSLFDAKRFGILENNISVADMMTDLQTAFGKQSSSAVGKATRATVETASDIFSLPDRLLRHVTWEGNIAQIKNIDPRFNGIDLKKFLMSEPVLNPIFPPSQSLVKLPNESADDVVSMVNKLINDGMSESQVLAELGKRGINTTSLRKSKEFSTMFNSDLIKREASIITHNEFPNPIMVPKRIRQLSAVSAGIPGVGFVSPFVMIPVETTRNMWNQAVRGAELLANGVKTGNTKMALAGGKKLALLGGITYAGYTAVKQQNFDKFGIGDEEDAILNEVVSDWDKDKPLYWTKIDPITKEARYIASDLLIPYNNQAKVIADLTKFFQSGDERYLKNANNTFAGMFTNDEFANTLVKPAIESLMNQNLRTGNAITKETGTSGVEERTSHFLNASFSTGLVRTLNDIVKAKKGYKDPFTGKEYTTEDIMNRIYGFRETNIRLDNQFGNSISSINDKVESEKGNIANALYKLPDMDMTKTTPDELLFALNKVKTDSEERSKPLVDELSSVVSKMQSLTIVEKDKSGKPVTIPVFSDRDIVAILEKQGVDKPTITQLLTGVPVKPTPLFSLINTSQTRLMNELKEISNTKGIYSESELEEKIKSYGPFANYEFTNESDSSSLSQITKDYNDYNDQIINKFLEKDSPTKQNELNEIINDRNIMIEVLENEVRQHIESYYKDPAYKNEIDAYHIEYLIDKLLKAKNVAERLQ